MCRKRGAKEVWLRRLGKEMGDGKDDDAELKDRWAARLEWYESDPAVVKDVREWRTCFKLK